MTKQKGPLDLTKWQKRYGHGFVMYSLKSGRAIAADPDYRKLIEKTQKKNIKRDEVSVLYLPDAKSVSIFPLSV